jgi:hypothetical protein
MAMLDKGRMLVVEKREWFERLRNSEPGSAPEIQTLTIDQQLIRQFLRGDADGPITTRRASTNYAEDLLGPGETLPASPSIEATRPMS